MDRAHHPLCLSRGWWLKTLYRFDPRLLNFPLAQPNGFAGGFCLYM